MRTKFRYPSWIRPSQVYPLLPALWLASRTTAQLLAAPGDVDLSFDPGSTANSDVQTLALQADGRILVGGKFTVADSSSRDWIARLHVDGSEDESFHASSFVPQIGGFYGISAIVFPPESGLLVGGSFTAVDGRPRNSLARMGADGLVDDTEFHLFDHLTGVFQASIFTVALQTNGQILAGGFVISSIGSQPYLGRVNVDGSRDGSFVPNIYSRPGTLQSVHSLAVQPDAKILLGGFFTAINGVARTNFARLNTDGSLDGTFKTTLAGFGLNQEPAAACLAIQSDGKILVGGTFTTVNGTPRANLARLHPDGSLDTTFLPGLSGPIWTVRSLLVQPDGKILIGGFFSWVNGEMRKGVARLNGDGSLDPSFVTALEKANAEAAPCLALALQPDRRILIGGTFTLVNQTPRSRLARLIGSYVAPTILASLRSQTAELGSTACFRMSATGDLPLSYKWYFNSTTALGGTTTDCLLRLTDVQPTQIGTYTVVVSNLAASVTSSPAMLSVIAPVERRSVPGLTLSGDAGSSLHIESADAFGPAGNWQPLDTVTLSNPPQWCFDTSKPLPSQRFYRAWQAGAPAVAPSLQLPSMVPALTMTGSVGSQVRVAAINAIGPTDAWFTLATVTLTNTTQLYFDTTAPSQPTRLYRVVPVP